MSLHQSDKDLHTLRKVIANSSRFDDTFEAHGRKAYAPLHDIMATCAFPDRLRAVIDRLDTDEASVSAKDMAFVRLSMEAALRGKDLFVEPKTVI